MKALIKNIKLPPGPGYHKPEISPLVVGSKTQHMRVLDHPPKPPIKGSYETSKERRKNAWPDEKLRKLGKLYNAGVSFEDMAKEFKCAPSTVSRYVSKARYRGYVSCSRQTHKAWTSEEEKELMRLHLQGCAADVIAKKLGRTRESVKNRLHDMRRR